MSANGAHKERDSLSLQTLVIAAIAAGAAAIVTSYFWKGGTILTAALTPVIVALVKEGLARPMESDLVRRPVQRLAEPRPVRRSPEYARTGAPSHFEEAPSEAWRGPNLSPPDLGPVRTYGRPRRQRWHIRAAIVTGVIAFAIAAAVLTVPELLFGGSVAGKGSTTFFSTHATKSHNTGNKSDQKTSTDKSQTDTNQQTTPPAQQPQGTQTSTQPQQSPPPQSAPQGGAPAPQQAPAPSTLPSSPSP